MALWGMIPVASLGLKSIMPAWIAFNVPEISLAPKTFKNILLFSIKVWLASVAFAPLPITIVAEIDSLPVIPVLLPIKILSELSWIPEPEFAPIPILFIPLVTVDNAS